ncbi:GTPase IMAP family member 4-like isoform X1 [Anabas testudineus]|uniref:GTPase IMAP family member 4-like isoform X1 n=1 Tax=Anabas testudineus TaxID=64144 RepID=UPI000E4610D3|nr:GTPase IMAP family member 4-like isoform X1 [Anabas testudineus]
MASKPARSDNSDLRVVLVGQERTGKSSAGNTILGKKLFNCRLSSRPVTLKSEKREDDVLGLRVCAVDTPGLFSTQLSEQQVKAELLKALELSSPGPHVFLLTIQLGRFTEIEQKGPETLEKMLSADICKYIIVLFTYGDRVENTDMDQFIREDENLQQLLRKCSGLWHVFNDKEMENRDQVKELFDKIESLSKGGRSFYERRSSVTVQSLLNSVSEPLKQLFSGSPQNSATNGSSQRRTDKEIERTLEKEGEEGKKKKHRERGRDGDRGQGKDVRQTQL